MRECFILFDEMQKTVSHDALLERPKDGLPADGTSDIRPPFPLYLTAMLLSASDVLGC